MLRVSVKSNTGGKKNTFQTVTDVLSKSVWDVQLMENSALKGLLNSVLKKKKKGALARFLCDMMILCFEFANRS